MMPRTLLAALLPLALSACGAAPASPWTTPAAGARDVSSGTPLERFFPLADGRVYHYATLNEAGEAGLLVARVHRIDASSGELRFPSGAKRFRFEADGVVMLSPAGAAVHVLEMPLEVGRSWPGEHGGTVTVTAVGAALDVPAGHFGGCVRTEERTEGAGAVRYATTFCPGTGIVELEAQSGRSLERAALKSYGEPFALGPEGVVRVP
jgi:hypothetical protein